MPFSTDYPEPCSPNGSFGEVASLVLNLLVVVSNYEGGYVMASRYDQRFLEFPIRPPTLSSSCSSRNGLRLAIGLFLGRGSWRRIQSISS